MEEEKREIKKTSQKRLIMDIGKTKYTVNLHFKQGAGETYKDKIDEARESFMNEASDASNRFNRIQRDNRSKLENAYSLNSKFMFDTVNMINETNTKTRKALDESVESFISVAEVNSKDTRFRLNAFQGMLSSAKVNGRVSSDVMKFLIRPIQLVEKNTVN